MTYCRTIFFVLVAASLSLFPVSHVHSFVCSEHDETVPCTVATQDDETIKVNSDLVVLNLTVTKSSGAYIHNLKLANFKVFEDGREERIVSFSVAETPFAAAILLDTSGSMEGRISLARSAAIRFLDGLRSDDVAAVYHFDTKVELVQEFSGSHDLEPIAFDMKADGYTVLNDAIIHAAKALSHREEKRRAIIILSDGIDTRSSASSKKALTTALSVNATIYTVDLSSNQTGSGPDPMSAGILRDYAAKSGGRYVATPGGQALREAFAGIVEELSNQYTIAYKPTNQTRDGRWRTIEVKIDPTVLDANVRTRKGYHAPKG
jgi:Ca-activated chloride channel family protein